MAVVVSIARGHDAAYPFKTIGAAEGPVITDERGAGYYLSAVEKGGEPAGTWVGNGAAELGFRDGDVVRRAACPECNGVTGLPCHECQGEGMYVMRACPLCGDRGWDYLNGVNDRDGIACRISCGYTWTAADPGWRAQVLPTRPYGAQ